MVGCQAVANQGCISSRGIVENPNQIGMNLSGDHHVHWPRLQLEEEAAPVLGYVLRIIPCHFAQIEIVPVSSSGPRIRAGAYAPLPGAEAVRQPGELRQRGNAQYRNALLSRRPGIGNRTHLRIAFTINGKLASDTASK